VPHADQVTERRLIVKKQEAKKLLVSVEKLRTLTAEQLAQIDGGQRCPGTKCPFASQVP
jgi:hypothetical protein